MEDWALKCEYPLKQVFQLGVKKNLQLETYFFLTRRFFPPNWDLSTLLQLNLYLFAAIFCKIFFTLVSDDFTYIKVAESIIVYGLSRYCFGVSPVSFLKNLQKNDELEKCRRSAMSHTGRPVYLSMYLACWIIWR